MIRKPLPMCGLLLFLTPVSAFAQPLSGHRFELFVSGGYLYGGTVLDMRGPDVIGSIEGPFPDGPHHLRFHVQFNNAPVYGLRLSYRVGERMLLEIAAVRSNNALQLRTLTSPATSLSHSPDIAFHTDYYLAFGLYEPWAGRIRPFVALGAGAADLDSGQTRETRFTFAAAAGMKAFLTSRFGVRVGGTGYATSLSRDETSLGFACTQFSGSPPGPVVPRSCSRRAWLTNGELGGGLFYRF